jgi:hypothetical protein
MFKALSRPYPVECHELRLKRMMRLIIRLLLIVSILRQTAGTVGATWKLEKNSCKSMRQTSCWVIKSYTRANVEIGSINFLGMFSDDHFKYSDESGRDDEPSLAEMVAKAIEVMQEVSLSTGIPNVLRKIKLSVHFR